MNGIQTLIAAHKLSDAQLLPMFEDLRDAPLETPFTGGGNHAHWILGHLTYSEGHLVDEVMRGLPNPRHELRERFRGGTLPDPSGTGYPGYDDLLREYLAARAATLDLLATLTDDDLDRPTLHTAPETAMYFGTYGACLLVSATHGLTHRGQLADIRRRLGRRKLLA